MIKHIKLGMLTPSSNTALEPITSAMVNGLPNVNARFSRLTVAEISLHDQTLGQFDLENILNAAELLADAHVDVITWNGTSSGWLGFERDETLCRQITEATGILVTTSVLALSEILAKTDACDFALVTPYLDGVQQRIVQNYARRGFECVAERHLDLYINHSFTDVEEVTIRTLVREVAQQKPAAITTFCTNLRAAHLVEALEAETGIPVYDTISTVVWKSLRLAGVDTRELHSWDRLFTDVA